MKMGRYPKVQAEKREKKKKGGWSKEEDQKLAKFINDRGLNGFTWETISRKAGLNRCAKSCRLRWKNYLDPHIRRGNFSMEEESTIIRLHSRLGNKWSQIAAQLPGRTDNDIKNFWNTKLRKQLDQKAANAECSSLPRTATTVANYLLGTLSILLGFLNMPLSEIAQNLLVQELWERMQAIVMASTPNYPFLPDNSTILQPGYGLGTGLYNENNAIPFEVHTNSTSDAWLGGGLSANFIDSNVAGMSSNYDLTEYDMLPALVSATDDEIPMPMTDEFYVDPISVVSIDYEWILNEMNYQSPDHLGSAMQENQILASCLDLSSSFMDSPSSSEIYDGAS